jgi:hypothetical protein
MIPETFDTEEPFGEDSEQERQMHLAGIMAKAAEEAGLIVKTDQFSFEWHSMFDAEIEAAQNVAQGGGAEGAALNVPSFNFCGEIGGNF